MGGGLGRLLSPLASDGPASLLPDGEAVAGADLLGVLEEASGACDDATGQTAEGCVVKAGYLSGPLQVSARTASHWAWRYPPLS